MSKKPKLNASLGGKNSIKPRTQGQRRAVARQPIAEKLIKKLRSHMASGELDLTTLRDTLQNKQPLLSAAASRPELALSHSGHAVYVLAQNELSRMVEELTKLPVLDKFSRVLDAASEEYMPSGPPMSPLTGSFFGCWALFDLGVGIGNETLGTLSIAVGKALGMTAEFERVFDLMQDSAMGVFVHEGTEGDVLTLRELVTDRVCRAVSPSGHRGVAGELWYARVLPPPLPELDKHVVFTTPYVLIDPSEAEWQAYFDRNLPEGPTPARLKAHRKLMKRGPASNYWNEFVFEAYVNYRQEVIFLEGLPDVAASRPHSSVNSK